ncbi:MAG: methionine aminotransferase [Flavobacteriales bacterium]|nr:methionine aminotransferase [Flavobacteriales bacterium]
MIRSKLPNVGTSIFAVMSGLARECKAINLSQGFPDFDCHPDLKKRIAHYMNSGHNQYAPMQGVPALREAIASKTERLYGISYDPEKEITVTAGATQAIYTAIAAVVQEGDEVIVFEPAYDCYVPAIELHGGKPVFVQLTPPDYGINWNQVKKLVNNHTRMIIINTPHNPTGTVMSAKDMEELQKLTKGTDIIVLSDEVYEHIIFEGIDHQSVARFPDLASRSFIISSFGKVYHTTGWKMGYCLAPPSLTEEFRRVHQFVVFSVNTPIQLAYADFMKEPSHYLELNAFYEEKRDRFTKLMQDGPFTMNPAKGTYFQLMDFSQVSEEKDTDYAIRLTREFGVASIPISVFYHNKADHKMLRFCFAKSNETLEKAARNLCKIYA